MSAKTFNADYKRGIKKAAAERQNLSKRDWVEIYYALDSKALMIERGELGADGEDEVCNAEWTGHLREIMSKIGPDGKNHWPKRGAV